jgi:hypothetical protein
MRRRDSLGGLAQWRGRCHNGAGAATRNSGDWVFQREALLTKRVGAVAIVVALACQTALATRYLTLRRYPYRLGTQ